jgi:hypothetical protein
MDHELVPRPYETRDWMLNSPREQFGLHQAKNVILLKVLEDLAYY